MNSLGMRLGEWFDDNAAAFGLAAVILVVALLVGLLVLIVFAVISMFNGDSPQYFDTCHRAQVFIGKTDEIVWSCTGSR